MSNFELIGFDKVAAKLAAYVVETKKRVQTAIALTALDVESGAKDASPVLTGRLRAANQTKIDQDGLGAEIYNDVVYALYVEMGTRFMHAKPFLFPAFIAVQKIFQERLQRALDGGSG